MKSIIAVFMALLGMTFLAVESEAARRMGGGGNIGKQRNITQQQAAPKAPAQQQNQAAPATPAQPPAGASKWLGPLAGLALGAGLAALFFNNGIAGALAGMLVLGLLIAAVALAARFFLRGRATRPGPMEYAGAGAGTPAGGPVPVTELPGGAGAHSVAATTSAAATAAGRWPAGFDAAGFVRQAKLNFVNLQAANDKGDFAAIRDFTTPDLYHELEGRFRTRGAAPQHTEVVTLDAEVLDVATEGDLFVVSVRFAGLIREAAGAEPESFAEIWHLEKPVSGRSGWLVSGIQQE
ncbi:MAG: Tim44 domain-containing protein [Burkholderiales bacterium]|nr:Tim44 domain-containing protein [Burkholderiales bacterium]